MNEATSAPPADQAPMGHGNGALRFLLELVALLGVVAGGAALVDGALGWVLGLSGGIVAAAAWGRYRVDGDPGPAPVVVPGAVRLALELTVWLLGGLGLAAAFAPWVPVAYGAALVVHHVAGVARLRWLLQR